MDPAAEEAFFRGVGLLEAGDPAAAASQFELAVTLQPDFRRAYYYRAKAGIALQDWSMARQSAEAYSRFELGDAEAEQLDALIDEINAGAPALTVEETDEVLTPPPPGGIRGERADRRETGRDGAAGDDDPVVAQPPSRTDDAVAALKDGHALLEAGECGPALESAQRALSLDPGLTDALLLKGLALECAEDWGGARAILLTYVELKGADDPVATRALERIDQRRTMAGPPAVAAPATPPELSRALGDDRKIEGVLADVWGDPAPSGGDVTRTRSLPGVGRAAVRYGRMELAGSRAEVEVARVYSKDGLVWSRLRVWGRDGIDTGGWFARGFAELYLSIVGESGQPATREGLPGPRTPSRNSYRALSGKHRWEVTWTDDDGDLVVLRLGRCSAPGNKNPVVAENLPCLELVGSSGAFTPGAPEVGRPEAAAVRLSETPGMRSWDIDVGIGGGLAPGFVVPTGGQGTAYGLGTFTIDLLGRFNLGALTVGIGWAPGVGLTGTDVFGPPTTWFDSRITFYVGFRDRPRQPQWRSLMLGLGVVPDAKRIYGTTPAALAVSLRLVDQVRRAPVGGFKISIEPTVVFGTGAVTVFPIRFTIGGVLGTKARLWGNVPADAPRWR